MPVFNGGEYFPRSVMTALSQTYSRFEIVLVNDGSSDEGATAAFCERMKREHTDKIVYIEQENGGVASALNAGLRAMRGDVFCWLSHDDLYVPEKLERQNAFFQRLGKSDAMLISDYDLIGPQDELIAHVNFDNESFRRSPRLPLYRGCVNGCTVFIPRKLFPDTLFPEKYRYTQDYWLWFELIKRYDFFHQPEILVRYRLHPGQDSRKPQATAEAEALWRAAVDDTSEIVRAQLYGSTWRFYDETHKILADAYPQVGQTLAQRRDLCVSETLVSVVIPFFNEPELVIRAAKSVLAQTHAKLEIILVNDGSTVDVSDVRRLAAQEPRIQLIDQANAGAAAARNKGLSHARGDYVAFLDADDQFLPEKISRQLEAMARKGALISHTSYYVSFPDRYTTRAYMPSGRQDGRIYPRVLGQCMIATPTVMIHRSLLAGGFRFPEGMHLGEDIMAWLDVLARHDILGMDEPLSIVEWSTATAAINVRKGLRGIQAMAAAFREHPVHSFHEAHISPLDAAIVELQKQADSGAEINEFMIREVFAQQG